MEDIHPAAVKIGMLPSAAHVQAIAAVLRATAPVPLVLDPVMIASSGYRLAGAQVADSMVEYLFPLATLVTPNTEEAALLTGMPVTTLHGMQEAAHRLVHNSGCRAVLVKGGHVPGPVVYDVLLEKDQSPFIVQAPYIESNQTHGTGCTLSSAIAVFLAQGHTLSNAVQQAKQYITRAIETGKEVVTGKGKGPLNHFAEPVAMIRLPLPQYDGEQ
jgi:hydroxymethylpyrimidine/phosphomethylpyrimidine kinase